MPVNRLSNRTMKFQLILRNKIRTFFKNTTRRIWRKPSSNDQSYASLGTCLIKCSQFTGALRVFLKPCVH